MSTSSARSRRYKILEIIAHKRRWLVVGLLQRGYPGMVGDGSSMPHREG